MTRDELARRLGELDPGTSLTLEDEEMAEAFGGAWRADTMGPTIETFAERYGCTYAHQDEDGEKPVFVKNDVF